MSATTITKLADILSPISRREMVDPMKEYPLLGIRLDAGGAFLREVKIGSQISSAMVSQVQTGDFIYSRLFAWRGAFDVISPQLNMCYVSDEFPTFIAKPGKIDLRFLQLWFRLSSTISSVEANCAGSTPLTRNRFKEHFFLALEIPLPSLEEQQRIVARIEELAGKIEEARGLRRETVEEIKLLNEVAANEFLSSFDESIFQPLKDVVTVFGGGTPSRTNPFFWEGNIPWVSPKDMKSRTIANSIEHISYLAVQESSTRLIEPDAILIVVRGMILVHTVPVAVLQVPATINQDIKALIPCKELLPEYLCCILWTLNHKMLMLVEKSTHDTRKLETSKLMEFRIPIPSLTEQYNVIAYLNKLQASSEKLQKLQVETAAELDALLPSVLDKAFRGEL